MMHDALWSDDEFRSFLTSLRSGGFFSSGVDDADRDRFILQARLRVAPEVQRRVLADVGAAIEVEGVAQLAFDVLDREVWGTRRAWLMVTPDPWRLLTDLVVREIRRSYRASVPRRADERTIAGIAEVSTRIGLEAGEDDEDTSLDEQG